MKPKMSKICICLAVVCGLYASSAFICFGQQASSYARGNYVLPAEIHKKSFSLAGASIPTARTEVGSRITEQLNFLLMDKRSGLMDCLDRLSIYGPVIRKILAEEKCPADLIYLAGILSDFSPNFKSRTGDVGIWKLGPLKEKNSSGLQLISTNEWDDRRDPVLSTKLACAILQSLAKNYSGDWLMAACAYADGPDRISQIQTKAPGFSYWDLAMPPYSEILIPRMAALKIIDLHRRFYDLAADAPFSMEYDSIDRIRPVKDLPLHVVAKWCGSVPRILWELNPGVDQSAGVLPVPDKRNPSGFPLRVPKGMESKVKQMLIKDGYITGNAVER